MKWTFAKLEPGDHIRVKRQHYYHHGVFVGNGMVVHFTGETSDSITEPDKVLVRKTSLEFFGRNSIVEKAIPNLKEKMYKHKTQTILENAEKAIGEGNYDFLHNNCEDLANRICYKKKLTSQIDALKEKI